MMSSPEGATMNSSRTSTLALAAGVACALILSQAAASRAADAAAGPAGKAPAGVVCNVKVLSDKVEDVSSLEAWAASNIKPGMTDEEKALAIWRTMIKYRHQIAPPKEFLGNEACVHDAMKTIHVYGYGQCCCASADIEQLGRFIGLEARGWSIHTHSVPELGYGQTWHLLDTSVMNYFRNPDGSLAGVADIVKSVQDWLKDHAEYRHNGGKLRQFAANEGWKKGPEMLAKCEWYTKDGANHAGWHGWYSTMEEYDCKPSPYEYGYSQGYRPNVQLRQGERLTRNWFNKGLHVNQFGGGDEPGGLLGPQAGRGGLGLQRKFGDIAPGRIGNGTLEYDVPLASGAFRGGALTAENLLAKAEDGGKGPAVHVKDAAKAGVLVVRMPSSYVYLGGELNFTPAVASGGKVTVSFSDNNGLDWKEIAAAEAAGPQKVDLKALCGRRYDYRLKFEMRGAGTGLDALRIAHDIQHSQAPLPALAEGDNTVAFSAGPQEGTITVEASTDPGRKGKQLVVTDFHPELKGVSPQSLRVQDDVGAAGGSATFPVEAPGDIKRVRFGGHYRARDAREGWVLQGSFDDGKTFKEAGKMPGPAVGSCKYVTVEDVPAGMRKALVRYQSLPLRNTICIFDFRIDVDYAEPSGGFRPVKVTYAWEEGGAPKTDVHVASTPSETYKITCGKAPLMKSLIVEVAE
jgi:hypothetical protein